MTYEEVYRASTVSRERVMDMMRKIRKSWCDPGMQDLMHAELEKASGPNGALMHSHSERRSRQQTNLLLALLITGTFMVIEVVGGLLTGSLALLVNAGHMLTDVAALELSAFAMWMAARPSTPEKSYGYHRAEILAAVTNAVVLLLLAIWILYEPYRRVFEPSYGLAFRCCSSDSSASP